MDRFVVKRPRVDDQGQSSARLAKDERSKNKSTKNNSNRAHSSSPKSADNLDTVHRRKHITKPAKSRAFIEKWSLDGLD